jgi:hypothetical protein
MPTLAALRFSASACFNASARTKMGSPAQAKVNRTNHKCLNDALLR